MMKCFISLLVLLVVIRAGAYGEKPLAPQNNFNEILDRIWVDINLANATPKIAFSQLNSELKKQINIEPFFVSEKLPREISRSVATAKFSKISLRDAMWALANLYGVRYEIYPIRIIVMGSTTDSQLPLFEIRKK